MNPGIRAFPSPPPARQLTTGATGDARGLVIQSTGNATLTIAVDEITLKDVDGNLALPVNVAAFTVTMDAATGINRLDAGSEAASSWYYVWIISDGINVAGLLSLADGKTVNSTGGATAPFEPVLPAGWNFRALVGVVRNDGSSNFVSFYQTGREVIFASTNIFTGKAAGGANTYEILSGATLTTYQATVPPLAKAITGTIGSVGAFTSAMAVAADVNGLGAVHVDCSGGAGALDTFVSAAPFRITVSSQNLAWKCFDTGARNRLSLSGFTI